MRAKIKKNIFLHTTFGKDHGMCIIIFFKELSSRALLKESAYGEKYSYRDAHRTSFRGNMGPGV